jgi:hypothetical protein
MSTAPVKGLPQHIPAPEPERYPGGIVDPVDGVWGEHAGQGPDPYALASHTLGNVSVLRLGVPLLEQL